MMPNHYSGNIPNHDAQLLAGSDDESICDDCPTGDGWHCHDCHATFDEPDVKPVFDCPESCCPECGSENVTQGCGKTEAQCRQEVKRFIERQSTVIVNRYGSLLESHAFTARKERDDALSYAQNLEMQLVIIADAFESHGLVVGHTMEDILTAIERFGYAEEADSPSLKTPDQWLLELQTALKERDAAIALEAENRRLADEGTVAIVKQLEETKAALAKAMETIRFIRLHTLAEVPTCEQLMAEAMHAIIVDIPVACDDMFSDPAATAAVATCTTCTHFRGEVCCNALSGRCADFITGGESCVSWEVQNAV